MRRRLVNLLSIGSLILCLAMIGMCVRSLFAFDVVRWSSPERGMMLVYGHCHGLCWVDCITGGADTASGFSCSYDVGITGDELVTSLRSYPTHIEFAGLHWFAGPYSSTPGATQHGAAIPMWYLIAAFALLPAWAAYHHFTRPPAAGLCPTCGYDLRATPERCPECGKVPPLADARPCEI